MLKEELDFCMRLFAYIDALIDFLDENPCTYPPLMRDVVCLLEGRVVKDTKGNRYLVNGLREQIVELMDTMEKLELEVCYEDDQDEGGD